jgi:hypothetical protein
LLVFVSLNLFFGSVLPHSTDIAIYYGNVVQNIPGYCYAVKFFNENTALTNYELVVILCDQYKKVNVALKNEMKAERERVEIEPYSPTLSLTSALDEVGDHCHKTRPLYCESVHILQDSGDILGPVWTGAGNVVRKQSTNTEPASP